MIQPPRHYLCRRTPQPPEMNGRLEGAAWASAPWTEEFVDILGPEAPRPRFLTRAKMLWDSDALYIGAELEEPHVWGTLTEHDSVIFHDNDFEVFLDPDGDGHRYVELEINALNTTWDLLLVRPYRADGPPIDGFELKGLRTAVHVDGTLNDASDEDRGWSVTIAIPWAAVKQIAGCPTPPAAGDLWRINFSRVQWRHDVADGRYVKVPNVPEDNWVWSPQGVVDMHRPEQWGVLQFADGPADPRMPDGWEERIWLNRAWDAQDAYRRQHGRWATESELPEVDVEATRTQFTLSMGRHHLDHELRFWSEPEEP